MLRLRFKLQNTSLRLSQFGWVVLAALFFLQAREASAQYVYTESFSNETANGWTFIQGDTSPGARLTSGLAPATVDPEYGQPQIDSSGQGWLRMATTTGNQANAAYLNIALPAAGAKVTVDFDFSFWGGSPNPGDGVAFFLADANVTFNAGAYGGSLGYAQKTIAGGGGEDIPGMAGGYVGMGLDVYGNYPNPTEGRDGGTGFDPNNVTVRGEGNGLTGYDFVGTADLDTVVGGANDNLGFDTYNARPDQDALDYRHATFTLNADNTFTIQLTFGYDSTPITVLSGSLTGTRPDEFRLGFTSGTGGATQVYELRNLEVQVDGGANSFFWDDNNGNNDWGTGANWDQNTVPTTGATVYFTDAFADVDSPETVNLNGNRTIGSAIFAGANAYTLTGSTLTFDALGSVTTSRIQIFNNPNGNAAHTIASNIQLNNNLEILHQVDEAFTLSGAINLQGNNLLVDTANTVTASGVISGTGGSLTKNGDGTLVVSGTNTYTGATTINNGILEMRNGSALGTTAGGATVNSGGTLGLANNITVTSGQAVTINGTGEDGLGALRNISGTNTWQGNITLASDSTIGVDSGSTFNHSTNGTLNLGSETLTLLVDGTANFNRTINDTGSNGTIIKDGSGTATFTGNNTGFDGDFVIRQGTVRASTDSDSLGDVNNATLTIGDAGTEAGDDLALLVNNGLNLSQNITVNNAGNSVTIGGYFTGNNTTTISGDIALNRSIDLTDSSTSASGTTFSGVISGNAGINKVDTGTVTLSGTNTFTGDVNIDAGTLRLGSATAIVNTVGVNVGAAGTFSLNNFSETIGSLSGSGAVTLGTATLTTGGNNASTTYSGVASGTGGITKTGTGTMTFTGANTFTGTLSINGGGTVAIDANNRFAAGSSLNLGNNGEFLLSSGADQTFTNLTISATTGNSALLDFSTADSDLLFTGTGTATAGTNFLTVQNWNGLLTGNGESEFLFNSNTAANNIAAVTTFEGWGAATVVTNGSLFEVVPLITGNEWDGTNASNNWNAGTVGVNTNWRTAGSVTDNNVAAPNAAGATALFRNLDPNLNGANISLNGNRTLGNLLFASTGNQAFTISGSTLTMDQTGTGTANISVIGNSSPTITSNVTLADNLLISNSGTGTLTFSTGTFTGGNFDITATGTGTTVISQAIVETAGGGVTDITKNSSGTLRLSGNNTYAGITTINGGVLEAQSNNALGSTAAGTVVNSGGTLGLSSGVTIGAEALTINGSGYNGVGALSNISGANTYSGAITLASAATIGSQAGTLTVGGGVATAGNTLTYHTDGGNINQSGAVTGTGGVVKTGANTLSMQNSGSTFSGGLVVNAGTVTVGTSGAGSLESGITIGAASAGQNYLGTGGITVNTGGTLTTYQNVAGGTDGYDFTARGSLTNNGGTITITNSVASDFNADAILNGAAINQNGGTTSFVDWNDLEVAGASTINVAGGTLNLNLTDDFNNATPNSNALNMTVTGGAFNVNLANSEGSSTFVLGTDDTLTLNGAGASMSINTGAAANQVNLSGRVNLYNGSTLTVTQGTTLLGTSTILDGGTGAVKGTLEVRGDLSVNEPGVANSPNLVINASTSTVITAPDAGSSITNLGTLTKTGTGTTTINSNVNNIEADRIVISQGTLLNGTSNQIDNNTKMTMGGGRYDTGGYDEIVGSLTLTANSTIDLDGAGTDSVLKFGNSSGESWTSGTVLLITGWTGSTLGGGTDQVYFGSSSSGLTSGQLGQIRFLNPYGFNPGTYLARILSTGEIVPYVPEASAALAALGLLGTIFRRHRRRRDSVLC